MQSPMGFHLGDFAKLYEQNTQRVLDDTYRLLSSFPSLIPKEDIYYNNEGMPETLMCLIGTVPISFRGGKYNIPLMMWVPKTYPLSCPTCFVTPTKDMVIKQNHKYVDPNGQCTVSRIEFWNPSVSLLELVTELCSVFSKEPPLFAKSATPSTTHASFRNAKPLPPTPGPSSNTSPPPHHPPARYTPPNTTSKVSSLSSSSLSSSSISSSSLSSSSISSSISPPPARSNNTSPNPSQSILYQKNELSRQVTQKLQKNLDEFFKATTKDMEMFMTNQNMLESRSVEIQQLSQSLEQEQIMLEQTSAAAINKIEEINDWNYRMEQPRDIDELVAPSDPISHQLFSVIAEDHALDDVLYYMGKALGCGKIDLDTYLKEVRSLSRQQFFLRAMVMKLNTMLEK